jgi:NADPH:quinone reductase-like Zn-dependent oxidoreductase
VKAIVQDTYGGTEVLALREIDKPAIADDQVLVAVEAAGVDQGVWHLMSGLPYMVRIMGFGLRAPKLPVRGTEVAGRVEAAGAAVTRFRPGDEVFGVCEGSFAEYAPAREDRLAPKPSNVTFDQAAAVPVSGGTALHSLRDRGELEAGQRALIIGAAGGVGTFAVQLAKALGAHVTGVCSGRKAELVRSIDADEAIDYTREDFADGRPPVRPDRRHRGPPLALAPSPRADPAGDARDRRRRGRWAVDRRLRAPDPPRATALAVRQPAASAGDLRGARRGP